VEQNEVTVVRFQVRQKVLLSGQITNVSLRFF